MFKLTGRNDPTDTLIVSKALQGAKNSGTCSTQQSPITRPLLHRLIDSLPSCASSVYEQALFKALFLTAYSACLRAGEIVLSNNPQHLLQFHQLHWTDNSDNQTININMSSFKHSNQRTPILTIQPDMDPIYCPVRALFSYRQMRVTSQGPLMRHPSGKPVTRAEFLRFLHKCLSFCGVEPTNYGTHSFRIGRATQMASDNVPDSQIRATGRWASNAYRGYIRPSSIILPK